MPNVHQYNSITITSILKYLYVKLNSKFLQMVHLIPDSEEVIKNLLQLQCRRPSKGAGSIKYHLDSRGKITFVHKKLKRFHVTVPVKSKKHSPRKGEPRLNIVQNKKLKFKLFPKKKTSKS